MQNDGTIGYSIKKARKKYPYTLEELGKKIGVTHAFLSRVENNKANPSDELLKKIAGALDPFNSADLLNEFKILTGKFKDIDKNSEVYKELKASGRLEMPQYNYDKSKPLLVDKPYYKLNFLFENDYRVFYDLKTSILGENIATIEIPPSMLDEIYKKINLTIIEHIKEHPYILKSIEDSSVLNDYLKKEQQKRDELFEHIKYMNFNDSMEKLMSKMVKEDDLI
ncbi:helix-turn-helix domain-containing protein [Staphylococcus haemolyticus]|nr:helix-turn-helix domain-containing protein [Staphylococcus haemolyticus]